MGRRDMKATTYLAGQRGLAVALLVIGVAMVVSTVARGGGPLSFGVVAGVLFAALGVARLKLARAVDPRGR
jgi:hypothetical protein